MNIFCHIPRENWIVDRMGQEFKEHSSANVSFDKVDDNTDVIWLLGSWCWNQIPVQILQNKTVVCTIHHEVPWKFDEKRKANFLLRDTIVDYYLTYNENTKTLIQSLSNKPVTIIPHWINTKIWQNFDVIKAKNYLDLPLDKYLIGSFQRDTEGSDLKTPKLEKGPDIFVEKVCDISKIKDVHVVLAGWRRQYVITELEKNNIPFTYFELPDNEKLNKLYNALDLYIVSSRCEGGPQAIFECAYLKTPIITTPVGQYNLLSTNTVYNKEDIITNSVLHNAKNSVEENFNNVKHLIDNMHIKNYDEYFKEILK